ncbi:MAG: hypothetical protein C5B52_17395, partial [Bacteroidetes bacterium]
MFLKRLLNIFRKKPKPEPEEYSVDDYIKSHANDNSEENQEKTDHKSKSDVMTQMKKNTNNLIPVEFQYLENLISYRLSQSAAPKFPDPKYWDLPVKDFVVKNGLDQDEATLLLIGLAPHAVPELFDKAIQDKIKSSGDFPEIGGVRGKNFRGFLPTGQTAIFLLSGDDWERRKEVEQLFWSDRDLARRKILWLEELQQGEPVMSGKITVALDYIDLFLFGMTAPPHFSTSFPAKKITTKLTSADIVMSKEVKRHYKTLEDWINYNPALMDKWGMEKRL